MRTLDTSRPYGTISPPYMGESFDRKAHFEQDGAFFDATGHLIGAGEDAPPPTEEAPAPVDPERAARIERILTDGAGLPAWQLQQRARHILGDGTPTKPREILATLRAELGRCDPRRARERAIEDLISEAPSLPFATLRRQAQLLLGTTCPAKGQAQVVAALKAALTLGQGHRRTAAVPQRPASPRRGEDAGASVDLVAWATGNAEIPFGQVQAEIKRQFAISVSDREQALDLLAEVGVIEPRTVAVEDHVD